MTTHILVVDDDPGVRALLARVLDAAGYTVTQAASVAAALEQAAAVPPSLVISDVSMPGGSGLDLCRRLPGVMNYAVPVMLLSGRADQGDFLAGFDAGACDYLPKPFDDRELLAKVQRHLRTGAQTRPVPLDPEALPGLPVIGDGRVRLVARLGHGGMASVYRGIDGRMGRQVAVKLLRPDLAGNSEFVLRFLQEARILGQLDLPGVPHIHDVGRTRDQYYYVMDLLEGRTLRAAVVAEGPLPGAALVNLGIGIARILEALVAHDIVHRDVKPDNVLCQPDGTVGLVDFGLARRPDDARLTGEDAVVGTLGYLAPEHLFSTSAATIQTDLYALGQTLVFAATGRDPVGRGGSAQALAEAAQAHAVRLDAERDDLPAAFVDLVRRLTERRPLRRPASAAAVVAALTALS